MRSPNYPAIGLRAAVDLLSKLWAAEKRSKVPIEVAVQAMGYHGYSGPTRSRVSALRKYGLIDQQGDDVQITDLGVRIMAPIKAGEREKALREAGSQVELFRELLAQHHDASDQTLVSILLRQEFTESGAKQAIQAYRDTIAFSKLDSVGYNEAHDDANQDHSDDAERAGRKPKQNRQREKGMTVLSFQISKRLVEVTVEGGPLTKSEIGVLKAYLGIQEQVAPESPSGDEPDPSGGESNEAAPPT